jgi:hypothetical protein
MGLTDADLYWLKRSKLRGVPQDEWDEWWEENGPRLEAALDPRLLSMLTRMSYEGMPELLQQHGISPTDDIPPSPTSEEYAVLSTALIHGLGQPLPERLIISGYFARWDPSLVVPMTRLQRWLSRDAKGRTAWDDLVFKNQLKSPVEMGGRLTLPVPFSMTFVGAGPTRPNVGRKVPPPDPVKWLKRGERWEDFQEQYGVSSILSLCRVGFGAEGREAVACFSRYTASRSNAGCRMVLHKGPAGWTVREWETAWGRSGALPER